ncbi:ABC transporter ATP-binding protein [Hoeflea poritis]|uniref:Spermidine/putrescine import ATP-binding protein PotA n=1 Tax=Hoeflea poritis TaxID=2993659 RepID=A0ABT4VSZ8_9HYPH|nr:ABC transporter ATP-binding protein [Hoeflea poritis]MDA4847836.1 ABC transporter ATP-binding protein [Hoeflea poritis]
MGQSVEIKDVWKSFGGFDAVRSATVKIQAGEFLSLLGPSGSGKSTLLMMVAGFLQPTSGKILIGDEDVTAVPANRRGIGMVFQKYALFPHMTVFENIAFPLKMRKLRRSEIESRVGQALDLVKLRDLGSRLPIQLSGGQQQRVAVARALVFEPPVLLMDEPLGALDKKLREEMQFEIKNLQQSLGVTMVYVTHDQEEALTMSDRVAVMNHGEMQQIADPKTLYREPGSPFVADFVGKMNLIEVTYVDQTASGALLKTAGGNRFSIQNLAVSTPDPERPMKIAARPETIALSRRNETSGTLLEGTIHQCVFMGSMTMVQVIVGPEDEVVYVQTEADASYKPGEVAYLEFDGSRTSLFAHGPDEN